jgi:NitT/TauT family transport system ATP-binding protein
VFWHAQPVRDESPNVSIVFQSFAPFPWLTVLENVEAPLEARQRRCPYQCCINFRS